MVLIYPLIYPYLVQVHKRHKCMMKGYTVKDILSDEHGYHLAKGVRHCKYV